MTRIICGVDVSKARLDAHVRPGGAEASFANDAEGIAALARFGRARGVELVVLEASGGYEREPFLGLWREGTPCALINPRNVRHFALAMGTLEKTDRIDARMIADFAAAKRIVPTMPPSADALRLKALVARLAQVTSDLVVQKQRLASAHDEEMRTSLVEAIAFFKRQAKRLEEEIAALIEADPVSARLATALRSVKGVAGRTVARLIADLPEIGTLSNKAIVKLAGLAPIADDSGKRTGRRHIRGGRAPVRSILYLVADIARRFDESLAAFKDTLTKAGKPKMVVRIALARKLLVRLNAKARDARIAHAALA